MFLKIYTNIGNKIVYTPGQKMLQSFSDEQLQLTARYINPEFWNAKFKSYPADLLFVQETAKEAKIE